LGRAPCPATRPGLVERDAFKNIHPVIYGTPAFPRPC
jgi:hypothetical protein